MLDVGDDMLAGGAEVTILALTGVAPEFVMPPSYDVDVAAGMWRSGVASNVAVMIGAWVDFVVDMLIASLTSLFNDAIICVAPDVGVDVLTNVSVNVLAVVMAALGFTVPASSLADSLLLW